MRPLSRLLLLCVIVSSTHGDQTTRTFTVFHSDLICVIVKLKCVVLNDNHCIFVYCYVGYGQFQVMYGCWYLWDVVGVINAFVFLTTVNFKLTGACFMQIVLHLIGNYCHVGLLHDYHFTDLTHNSYLDITDILTDLS